MSTQRKLKVQTLTKGHDLFECNLCSFESGHKDSIREHLIAHVNPQNEDNSVNIAERKVDFQASSLLDEYDDDGNYIGDNPKYMDDIEQESDTADEEDEQYTSSKRAKYRQKEKKQIDSLVLYERAVLLPPLRVEVKRGLIF